MNQIDFDDNLILNGKELTKKYLGTLNKQERLDLIEPIFSLIKEKITEFPYPDDKAQLKKEWKKLIDLKIDTSVLELHNNSSMGTIICKYFCHSFYSSCEDKKRNMLEVFQDDDLLKKIIYNRLGLEWFDQEPLEAFNFSPKMLFFQAPRSMRLVAPVSMFKPNIAKYMYEKYSNPGDTVGDYSCGFGGRLLGAMASGRKYIGTDPLTTPELENMAKFFDFKDYQLINSGSEDFKGSENSIDLYWSSPPYYNQEVYSKDQTQAYNKGEDYFYNTYWKNTLLNIKYMLKPGKWFGLNVKNYPKMLDMAKDVFGEVKEEVFLKTVRSHLNKTAGTLKYESVYMFINDKRIIKI